MLNGRLTIHGVDIEQVAANTMHAYLRRHGDAKLRPCDHEDLLAYLVETAWETSLKFDPERNNDFDGWLTLILSKRPTDWYRKRFYDARHGNPQERAAVALPYSLDAPLDNQADPYSDQALGGMARWLTDPDTLGGRRDENDRATASERVDDPRSRNRKQGYDVVRRGLPTQTAA
jgi:DNA-directed RNA polymerase specialized sigma24 family protein